jgi:Trk K+ transport system NAD-binding subunit
VFESKEDKFSTKSQLDVIPPSSLLSGINDERSNQLQILQKQKFQQQEHLREQQRLEQEKIDEQKMLHQQQKWLLQNETRFEQLEQTNSQEKQTNIHINTCNAANDAKGDIDVKATVTLANGNVSVWQEPDSAILLAEEAEIINKNEIKHNVRVKIIEKNKERAEFIVNELNNTIVINGDGLDEEVLKEANIEEAETILSLTNDDEDNIMVCVLAEKNNPNKRTIALVNKQNYSLLQSSLKIDDLVDPRLTTISTILKHVHKGTIETVYTLLDGEYEFIEAEVLETSELISKSIKDSNLPKEIRIGAVVRGKDVVIPKSDFKFEKKDLVVFLTMREHLEKVESLFRISSLV